MRKYDHRKKVHLIIELDGWAKPTKKGELFMENWYVIQVRSGQEERIVQQCHLLIDQQVLNECFIPKYKRLKKDQGKWQEVEETLFKGYVFMISDDVKELFQQLHRITDLTKLLGKYGEDIYPLHAKEIEFLKSFGKEEHIIECSVGYVEGDQIIIEQGPLKGKEAMIRKINRHKRIAEIELEMFGKTTTAKIGLEIVSKQN